MKTNDRLHQLIPWIACLCFALAAVSCQSTSKPPKTTRVPMSLTASKWVMVSSQPPTYYPRGVAADCKTDHWSGEWVETGDAKGTRYFIPLHGLGKKREMLIREALAARRERKLAQVEAEDEDILSRNIRNAGPGILGITVITWASMGYCPTGDGFYRMRQQWRETKEPAERHGW